MHILITGGTGFIGSALAKFFLNKNYKITILTRSSKKRVPGADMVQSLDRIKNDIDIVINLAGKRLDENRWNKRVKQEIYDSRVVTTRKLVSYLNSLKNPPKLFISGSAIGYYGSHKSKIFTEKNKPEQECFTVNLCKDWEAEAQKINPKTRLCILRTGIVLSKDDGALPKMALPIKFYAGAVLGSGFQYMSWIHINDVVNIIDFIIENNKIDGPINLACPDNLTNGEFTYTLADVLNRPIFFSMPSFIVRLLFGEMAEALLLNGQRIYPQKLIDAGFKFKFENLILALRDLYSK